MYHIAATLGMTVGELNDRLSYTEYIGWIEYFNRQAPSEEDDPNNMMSSPDAMLKGFGL